MHPLDADFTAAARAGKRQLRSALNGAPLTPGQSANLTTPAAARIALFCRQLLWGKRHVGLYDATGHEVCTLPLLGALRGDGVQAYLPRTCGRGLQAKVEFVPVHAHTKLVLHVHGMREPPADLAAVATAGLQAVVVPAIGFDLHGNRLGHGWGCYDRALAGFSGLVVGLAYARQICAPLPAEAHDRRMDFLVTPFGIWPTHSGRAAPRSDGAG